MRPLIRFVKVWAKGVKRDIVALWIANGDPRTPAIVRMIGVVVVAYALSPIDLIPDFIPVLGFIDDAILLPALIWLAVRLMPDDVLSESRVAAEAWLAERGSRPTSRLGLVVVLGCWLLAGVVLWRWLT